MVQYSDETLFPTPRSALWELLNSHLDDTEISKIHHLILSQKTMQRTGPETIVERRIDVRGKGMRSVWKLTYRPPEFARWEIVESQGPWAPGSYIENRYSESDGGTRIVTRGDLRISVLPFFLPQKSMVRRVLATVHDEDVAYLGRRT